MKKYRIVFIQNGKTYHTDVEAESKISAEQKFLTKQSFQSARIARSYPLNTKSEWLEKEYDVAQRLKRILGL